jgi:nitrogen regulatory protein P-II 1
MALKQIVAIIRPSRLESVESRLLRLGVAGITVTRTKGFGEYADFLVATEGTFPSVRIDIFIDETHTQHVVDAIIEAAHTGTPGDGIVAILPVDRLYRIRSRQELTSIGLLGAD